MNNSSFWTAVWSIWQILIAAISIYTLYKMKRKEISDKELAFMNAWTWESICEVEFKYNHNFEQTNYQVSKWLRAYLTIIPITWGWWIGNFPATITWEYRIFTHDGYKTTIMQDSNIHSKWEAVIEAKRYVDFIF